MITRERFAWIFCVVGIAGITALRCLIPVDAGAVQEEIVIRDAAYFVVEPAEPEFEPPVEPEPIVEAVEESTDAVEEEYVYYEEPVYYDYTPAYEPSYSGGGYSSDPHGFKSAGVVYDDNGTRYTWYSQNSLPGGGLTELNNNGRHVNDEGFVCDGDGYISVASSDHPIGTVVETPFGEGKVYDTGCASGTIDIYTNY